jgi:hypothetical protein
MIRPDLSEQLIHLTKGETLADAEGAFRSILAKRALIGGNGHVRGGYFVVCFSEAPVEVLARIFSNPEIHGFRYRPFGVMLPKLWLFERGGRPVIYQPDADFDILPEQIKYRHVRLDEPGSPKDFTFEREWRIQTERLDLDPTTCTLIVPTRNWDYKLRDEHAEDDMRIASTLGMNPLVRISDYPWHVLALEDLGTRIPIDE